MYILRIMILLVLLRQKKNNYIKYIFLKYRIKSLLNTVMILLLYKIFLPFGLMLTLLRSVHISNIEMHNGKWHRFFGRRLSEITIGIIGVGRIGTGVLKCPIFFGEHTQLR